MRIFKEKLTWVAPIAVILKIALFSMNLFAKGDPQVKNLSIICCHSELTLFSDYAIKADEKKPTLWGWLFCGSNWFIFMGSK